MSKISYASNKDKAIDDLLLLITKKNKQIKKLEETINLATDGIEALSPYWDDKDITKDIIKGDVQAIKKTLENYNR